MDCKADIFNWPTEEFLVVTRVDIYPEYNQHLAQIVFISFGDVWIFDEYAFWHWC